MSKEITKKAKVLILSGETYKLEDLEGIELATEAQITGNNKDFSRFIPGGKDKIIKAIETGDFDYIVIHSFEKEYGREDRAIEMVGIIGKDLRSKIVVVSVFVLNFCKTKLFQEMGVGHFTTTHSASYYLGKLLG